MRNIPQIIYLLIDSENNNTDDFNELNAEDIFWNDHSNDSRDPEYVLSELLKEKDEQIKELKNVLRLAGVPELIIDHPELLKNNPTEKHIEWAKKQIEHHERPNTNTTLE